MEEGRGSRGMFCQHVDENGEICNALMTEKSIFFHCPKCGHVEMMSNEDRAEKFRQEARADGRPGKVGLAPSLSLDGNILFASAPRRASF